jgi:hypothetical protein
MQSRSRQNSLMGGPCSGISLKQNREVADISTFRASRECRRVQVCHVTRVDCPRKLGYVHLDSLGSIHV